MGDDEAITSRLVFLEAVKKRRYVAMMGWDGWRLGREKRDGDKVRRVHHNIMK